MSGRRGGADPARWHGANQARARAAVGAALPAPCGRCGGTVTADSQWVVGHALSRAAYPELTMEPSNWRPEHRSCSDRSAQQAVQEKARRDALREHGIDPGAGLPGGGAPGSRRPPSRTHTEPTRIRPELGWAFFKENAPEWLQDVLDCPEDVAAPPLAMTPVHPEATGTYGPEACAWVEANLVEMGRPVRTRWWQRLCLYRILEHRADGSLCWEKVIESCPRRSGKSVLIKALAMWRISHPDLFGETQTAMHVANKMDVAREIHRPARIWVDATLKGAGWKTSNNGGNEEIVSPTYDRWLVRSAGNVYGYTVTLGIVDEAWDVEPKDVDEGLEPTMMERLSAQLVLSSTSHSRATSLMKSRVAAALAEDDGDTLLLLWAAPEGADPGDEATWRAASPHWSADRRKKIAGDHARALAGEVDPDADDPDPWAKLLRHDLNMWQFKAARRPAPGHPVATDEAWSGLAADVPDRAPDAVAVEGWFGESGVSVARAWKSGGRVVVSVTEHPDSASAAAAATAAGCPNPARVGKSLMLAEPAFRDVFAEPAQGITKSAVQELARLLGEGALRHDGSPELARQVLAVRTMPSADGVTLKSRERADAVKAVVWAAEAARTAPEPSMIW